MSDWEIRTIFSFATALKLRHQPDIKILLINVFLTRGAIIALCDELRNYYKAWEVVLVFWVINLLSYLQWNLKYFSAFICWLDNFITLQGA